MNTKIRRSVSWKNSNNTKKKSSLFDKLKGMFTRKNNSKLHKKHLFPNTVENVEARKGYSPKSNSNNNNNNNNSNRKNFFSTPKHKRKEHYQKTIENTLYKGKYFKNI